MNIKNSNKIFYFVSIDKHIKQGHFQSWRELCKTALNMNESFFLEYKNFNNLIHDLITNRKKYQGQHLHLEWIHDLNYNQIYELDSLANEYNFSWSSHMAISQAVRKNKGSNKKAIEILFNELKKTSRLTAIWSWDIEFDGAKFGNFRVLGVPDVQSLDLKPMTCSLCLENAKPGELFKGVGLAGQLYGYRGVDFVAILARKYKNKNFLLLGKKFPDSFNKKTVEFLKTNPKNLFITDKYFETDFELNHAIKHLSCLIIDTSRYPEPSGIAVRALAFGIPVLIMNEDSYLRYLSRFSPGIHVAKKSFLGYKKIDWEKITKPTEQFYESHEAALIKILKVAATSLRINS